MASRLNLRAPQTLRRGCGRKNGGEAECRGLSSFSKQPARAGVTRARSSERGRVWRALARPLARRSPSLSELRCCSSGASLLGPSPVAVRVVAALQRGNARRDRLPSLRPEVQPSVAHQIFIIINMLVRPSTTKKIAKKQEPKAICNFLELGIITRAFGRDERWNDGGRCV